MWIWIWRGVGALSLLFFGGKAAKDIGEGLEKTFKYLVMPVAVIYVVSVLKTKKQ